MSNIICQVCRKPASIRMRQHRLALCKPHYLEWFIRQTQRSIEKYHMFGKHERLLVAVSGGKDSLAVWDVLWQLGYQAEGLYIHLGIGAEESGPSQGAAAEAVRAYSQESEHYAQAFAAQRGLKLHVANVKSLYGKSMPEMAHHSRRGRGKPCSVCGVIKRHIMNELTQKEGFDVLVTGHNLDDEAAVLFSNTLSWQMGLLLRQAPVLEEAEGFARKAKPLCRFYERETTAYALLQGIDYIYDECPFSQGSTSLYYKEILNRLEADQPGAKVRFYADFIKARKQGYFVKLADPEENNLHPCERCSQPTSAPGLCAFCRVLEQASQSGAG